MVYRLIIDPGETHEWYWQITGKRPPRYPPRIIAIVAAVTFAVWELGTWFADWNEILEQLYPTIFLVIVVAMIGSMFYCIIIATHRVTSMITSHHWDLLRLTPLKPEYIFADLYVSIQVCCWKVRVFEIAIRVVVAELLFLLGVQNIIQSADSLSSETFMLPFIVFLAMQLFISEARWRFMTVIAVSIAVATRIDSFLFAALAASATISGLNILQLFILSFPLWTIVFLHSSAAILAFALCSLLISLSWGIVLIFWFYRKVRDRALTFAQRELFRAE